MIDEHEPTYAALEWHLLFNQYPPQPRELVVPCLEAIEAWQEGEPDRLILLNRDSTTPAWEVASLLIENLRLEDFLHTDNEWSGEW